VCVATTFFSLLLPASPIIRVNLAGRRRDISVAYRAIPRVLGGCAGRAGAWLYAVYTTARAILRRRACGDVAMVGGVVWRVEKHLVARPWRRGDSNTDEQRLCRASARRHRRNARYLSPHPAPPAWRGERRGVAARRERGLAPAGVTRKNEHHHGTVRRMMLAGLITACMYARRRADMPHICADCAWAFACWHDVRSSGVGDAVFMAVLSSKRNWMRTWLNAVDGCGGRDMAAFDGRNGRADALWRWRCGVVNVWYDIAWRAWW